MRMPSPEVPLRTETSRATAKSNEATSCCTRREKIVNMVWKRSCLLWYLLGYKKTTMNGETVNQLINQSINSTKQQHCVSFHSWSSRSGLFFFHLLTVSSSSIAPSVCVRIWIARIFFGFFFRNLLPHVLFIIKTPASQRTIYNTVLGDISLVLR